MDLQKFLKFVKYRSNFLTYIIFPQPWNVFEHFLQGRCVGNKIPQL
jgi:hypothetical protein